MVTRPSSIALSKNRATFMVASSVMLISQPSGVGVSHSAPAWVASEQKKLASESEKHSR